MYNEAEPHYTVTPHSPSSDGIKLKSYIIIIIIIIIIIMIIMIIIIIIIIIIMCQNQ